MFIWWDSWCSTTTVMEMSHGGKKCNKLMLFVVFYFKILLLKFLFFWKKNEHYRSTKTIDSTGLKDWNWIHLATAQLRFSTSVNYFCAWLYFNISEWILICVIHVFKLVIIKITFQQSNFENYQEILWRYILTIILHLLSVF